MLHTLSHSPYQTDFDSLLRNVGAEDEILLFQDGVIASLEEAAALVRLLVLAVPIYVLKEDVEARGLTNQVSGKITLISYTQFVQLTARHSQQLAW
ncbi:sulfurtransferase complex subunit TusB [Prodigiosinella confusarubida]|uniref:Protein TusB n=1 Tax=Serratia sp. (strain ATCC 39006) TaxID=104623 RepID=A0A2I5TG12_SERS3|nr:MULTISPECIES: sulfurtransferase complex subunit TusB [Enterobacterales]WJV57930.1 sulfurtransferase complex subunit TusB [Pectobacteriaceae bacterium C111]WJY15433.1 sulfurtransferase complex subunit TusB [Pectobacteriaceae bacterium CE90]AUG99171.1 sulfurtransferase complex subunit TusB [Serratia sp. ATCC 39006]AUH03487.1 sulfurtransferase complex subunit TusB [Serratia sp. ATCC 39006]WJV53570.1 sulfurtransferase complex subunit TusB [Prodigiosinella sp. LS101]